jgi:hypothetical protein
MKPLLLLFVIFTSCSIPLQPEHFAIFAYIEEERQEVAEQKLPRGYLAIVDDDQIIFENIYDNATDYNQAVRMAQLDVYNSNKWLGTNFVLILGGF